MSRNSLHSNYKQLPARRSDQENFKLAVKDLHPTQLCVGLAEVLHRQKEFSQESTKKKLEYLQTKPIPIVCDRKNELWMLDRHHRLRAILEIDNNAEAYGYIVAETNTNETYKSLEFLSNKGWLYLYDNRGRGPYPSSSLPKSLLGMEDDSYRSLVWKLKREGLILPSPLIPYHEFRWSSWLRTRSLPPFNSRNLSPALSIARELVRSKNASHLAGWKGMNV